MTIRADSSPGTTSRQLGTQTEFAVMTCVPKGVSVTKEPTRPDGSCRRSRSTRRE